MITYQKDPKLDFQEVIALYESVEWFSYTNQLSMLQHSLENSLLVLAAFKQERLIGLLRAVGDGYSIVFIQDILVRPEYQRQGIGRALFKQAVNHFPDVYQLHLLTDNSRKTCAFYESLGFTKVSNINCVAYTYVRDAAISGEMFTE